MSSGLRVTAMLTMVGALTAVGLQWLLRRWDPSWTWAVAQAAGFSVAWCLAWPLWFRSQPNRRFGPVGHTIVGTAAPALVAAARIVLQIG